MKGRIWSLLRDVVWPFLAARAKSSWVLAKGNWRQGMRQDAWLLYPLISGIVFPVLVPDAFSISWQTGLSYVVAGTSAIYSGFIFRHPMALVIVFVGVIFGGTVTGVVGDAVHSAATGAWIPSIMLLGVAAYMWVWAKRMQKVDFEWEPPILTRVRRPTTQRGRPDR